MSAETVLTIEHLNKSFGKKQIIKDLSMELVSGEVYGFLGPNGAGKTTTIKMIVGLLRIDSGSIKICGKDLLKNYEEAMGNIGGIVENPEMYKYLTGRQNLRQYARMRKGVTPERIEEVIELVGLSNWADKKISKYSLGMRQRLGIAQAILHRPKILILDEPTNGLDPAGIKQMRGILRKLAHEEGVCVMVSSHLMSEMELMCDRVAIISKGELIEVQTIEELVNENSITQQYIYEVNDPEALKKLLLDLYKDNDQVKTEPEDENKIVLTLPNELKGDLPKINKAVIEAGIELTTVSHKASAKLEDAFIELTTDEQGGGQIA